MIEQTVTVTNRLGLHARAAATLVRTASRFSSDLALARPGSDTPADAKSILNVLMLSASQGTALHLSANGPDETAALATVAALFAQGFGEEEHIVVRARTRGPRPTMTRQGLSVSPGIVVGRVMRLFQGTPQVFRSVLAATEVDHEIHRLRAAVRLARRQLSAIKTRASQEFGEEHAYIFDAHLLMVSDHKLLDDIENFIRREMVKKQRQMGLKSGAVMEGRDITTKVFPDADFKLYFTASPQVRAKRRYRELVGHHHQTTAIGPADAYSLTWHRGRLVGYAETDSLHKNSLTGLTASVNILPR